MKLTPSLELTPKISRILFIEQELYGWSVSVPKDFESRNDGTRMHRGIQSRLLKSHIPAFKFRLGVG
jgi:hypothetical protein